MTLINRRSRPWKDSEVETMRTLLLNGRGYLEISKTLKRSAAAVREKARSVGLYKPTRKAPQIDDTLPDEYYEGVAADREIDCPYCATEMQKRCWWMAGFHDGKRGVA